MGPAAAGDGLNLTWEPNLKRPKEEILDGSQVSSLDFFKMGPISTGLGLSLDNLKPNLSLASSSGESSSTFNLLPAVDDAFHRELQRMDAEMDSFLRLQVMILPCFSLGVVFSLNVTIFLIDLAVKLCCDVGRFGFNLSASTYLIFLWLLSSSHLNYNDFPILFAVLVQCNFLFLFF